ncbi:MULTISPECIES: DUF1826 domain-containing protein [Empedobacter]|uniref:DUF1826 domain-containing protein n=1 Tax=Empedobacter falsenii TaxID=343874 RepID=A0A7H9DSN5_9FLAO|nr:MULTISPECIES: DUF1826 domain-containing protein [Empedobacter]MDH2206574.1 DUF1826 domain-containing protein [Empedobacter sp. GD03644]QLL58217.1 DUF1826 domain-containing protein [Empedobacter falsenii]
MIAQNNSNQQQVLVVSSFDELVYTAFSGKNNAINWQRNLEGDFEEIVNQLILKDDITVVSIDDLNDLDLSKEGIKARNILINDLQQLTVFGASPTLNLLKCYERDTEFDFISTDVYSFHVDRSPIPTDTFLCTYYGASSDIVANEDVEQKILIPEIRENLFKLYDGHIDGFEDFLKEYFFDLHYQIRPGVEPINLGLGNLWRLAVDHPEQKVLPCVHRAPKENKDEYRLLLIC